VMRRTIEMFLSNQRGDGLIPYLILRGRQTVGKYFGRHKYYKIPKAIFRSYLTFGTVPDGGILAIIATRRYVEKTGDTAFIKLQYKKLQKAFDWYGKKTKDGLIHEWFACEWADVILKVGKVLYTNVLYYKAAVDMAWLARKMKKSVDKKLYAKQVVSIARAMRKSFWNGSYFADWIDWRRHDYLATHPNMLAIIFGLTTKKESQSILRATALRVATKHTMLQNTDRPYPLWRVHPLHISIGVPDYHNGLTWLQPGIVYSLALFVSGKKKEAKETLSRIADLIVKHKEVYEVYEVDGSPVKRPFYRSEGPFAWSAGLFLFAADSILSRRKN
jgi:glycogen debranching enzyme